MASDSRDQQLQGLFEAYRDACPDMEGSASFMPGLWQKIEARQALPFAMCRFAQFLVSAAAAMCLLMAILLTSNTNHSVGPGVMTYVEALDSDSPHDVMAYADIENVSAGDTAW